MPERPHVILSVASSIDGYIDDTSERRLILSNQADFERVDDVRASVDAILVGANTIRRDNPRLLVRSAGRRRMRRTKGLPESPAKVTITGSCDLDPDRKFFTEGNGEKLVYTSVGALDEARARLGETATVIGKPDPLDVSDVLADLADRGFERLMVEGGGMVHTQFLTAGLADELHLVIAPFFVGDSGAVRFANTGRYRNIAENPMRLSEVRQIGEVVLLRYHLRGS